MAFNQEAAKVPADIGNITVILSDKIATAEDPAVKLARFQIDVLDASGARIRQIRGDLQPHLTGAQVNGLLDFMADLRTQAVNEVIGT